MMNKIDFTGHGPLGPMPKSPDAVRTEKGAGGFDNLLARAMGEVNQRYAEADRTVADLATGRSRDVHQVMINTEKADVQFRLLMQVRNKIVSAYETIMRMGI